VPVCRSCKNIYPFHNCKRTIIDVPGRYFILYSHAYEITKIIILLQYGSQIHYLKPRFAKPQQQLRTLDISGLARENKNFIFNLIDMALRDMKAKKAYS